MKAIVDKMKKPKDSNLDNLIPLKKDESPYKHPDEFFQELYPGLKILMVCKSEKLKSGELSGECRNERVMENGTL